MKYLKTTVLFLLILFIGQWVISISFEIIVSKSSFRFSKLYSKSEKMDNSIVCIGNSRGVNSFFSQHIDKKYDVKSFNLSYNSMNMPIVSLFLEDYLENHKSPKTIFIEVSNLFILDSTINYATFNLYSKKSKKLAKEIKETDYKTHLITSIFPIYKYNTEMFYRSLFYLKKSDQDWINRHKISKELETEIIASDSFNLEISNNNDLVILKSIVDNLKEKGINVILFIAPYHPEYLLKIKNLNSTIDIIEKAIGYPIQDISGFIKKSEYFADRVHTNENGAISISDTLMKLTIRNNKLK